MEKGALSRYYPFCDSNGTKIYFKKFGPKTVKTKNTEILKKT